MHARAAVALAVALMTAAACSAQADRESAKPAEAAGPTKKAGKPMERQYGIALPAWDTGDYGRPEARSYVQGIAATGAGWIQFNPTWYQRSATDSVIRPTGETVGDAGLRSIIGLARAAGLKVLLKPHVDLPGDVDRATIRPKDPKRWYESYGRFIGHYAELAEETGVSEFAVGTELAAVSGDRAEWLGVIKAVRRRFHGELVYAANYDAYRKVAFWDAVDLIGIDAYWPLGERATKDPAALRRAWRPVREELARFAASRHKRILFTEAGYVSQQGATTEPCAWDISKVNGNDEQAAAYQALLETFSGQRWWAGVHWWMWDDWPGSDETPRNLAYTPHGKPAERVLRQWWSTRP